MTLYTGLDLLDGDGLRQDWTLRVEDGIVTETAPRASEPAGLDLARAGSRALICPGFIDLQVNGGGGLMLDECYTIGDLKTLTDAHAATGTLGLLPTLISDRPKTVSRIIELTAEAAKSNPAILGLHPRRSASSCRRRP